MTIRIEIMMARGSVEKMTLLKKDIIETTQINISAPSIAMMTIKGLGLTGGENVGG